MQFFSLKQFDAFFLTRFTTIQFYLVFLYEYKSIEMSRCSYSRYRSTPGVIPLLRCLTREKHRFKRRSLMSFVQCRLGITGLLLITTTRRGRGWVEARSSPLGSVGARCLGYFNIDRKYDSNFVRVTYTRYEINYALQLVRRGTTATRVSRDYRAGFNSILLRCYDLFYGHGVRFIQTNDSFIKDASEQVASRLLRDITRRLIEIAVTERFSSLLIFPFMCIVGYLWRDIILFTSIFTNED